VDPTLTLGISTIIAGIVVAVIQSRRKPISPSDAASTITAAATQLIAPLTAQNAGLEQRLAELVLTHSTDMDLITTRFRRLETVVRRLLTTHNGKIDPATRTELEQAITPGEPT